MQPPLAPGPRRPRRAPLPTISLVVGGTLCALALLAGFAPTMMASLAQDPLVMRALGVTIGFAAFMLARVAMKAAAGFRRMFALLIAVPLLVFALALLVKPDLSTQPYDAGLGIVVPWIFGLPGVLALMLSRWRVAR